MFGKGNSQSFFPYSTPTSLNNDASSTVCNKSSEVHSSSARIHRDQIKKQMRWTNDIQVLPYPFEGVSIKSFTQMVESEGNPYSILRTIFVIADEFSWRHYLAHLQLLIKKFTNTLAASNGKILEQLSGGPFSNSKRMLGDYSLQQRIESMLHLSNKHFQGHLLLLIHGLVAYNNRYGILDENSLSEHMLYRHNYERHVREEIIWLLTRMSLSSKALAKVMSSYLSFPQTIPLLGVLMIISNYIYEQPLPLVEHLAKANQFKEVVQRGLFSENYESEREAVLIYNNLICKSKDCAILVLRQPFVQQQILNLNNEESTAFRSLVAEILDDPAIQQALQSQN